MNKGAPVPIEAPSFVFSRQLGDHFADVNKMVQFGEHTLYAVPGSSSKDWAVVLKPTCEAMGVDFNAQLQRLKRDPKATVCMTHTVAEDGKIRETVVIDRKTFKWMLATINTGRIWNKEARSKSVSVETPTISSSSATALTSSR